MKEDVLRDENGEALEQATQRSCGCSIPGFVQVGRVFEQPGLMEGVPAHVSGVGPDHL